MEILISDYGIYLLIGAFLLDDLGIFLPTTTLLFTATIYAHHSTDLSIWQVIFVALIIPPISNRLLFEFGKRNGRKWLAIHGYKICLPTKRIRRSERFIDKYGPKTIWITSAVPTFRPFGALIAGSLNMKGWIFSLFNILGVCTMVGVVMSIAYIWGDEIGPILEPYWGKIILGIILYSVIHMGVVILKQMFSTQRILVIGHSQNEHAFCNGIIRSQKRIKLYNFSEINNIGIQKDTTHIQRGDYKNHEEIFCFIEQIKPHLCLIGDAVPKKEELQKRIQQKNIQTFFLSQKEWKDTKQKNQSKDSNICEYITGIFSDGKTPLFLPIIQNEGIVSRSIEDPILTKTIQTLIIQEKQTQDLKGIQTYRITQNKDDFFTIVEKQESAHPILIQHMTTLLEIDLVTLFKYYVYQEFEYIESLDYKPKRTVGSIHTHQYSKKEAEIIQKKETETRRIFIHPDQEDQYTVSIIGIGKTEEEAQLQTNER